MNDKKKYDKYLTSDELKDMRLKLTALANVNKRRMLKTNENRRNQEKKIIKDEGVLYKMTEEQKRIHDFAPFWEEKKKKKKYLEQSKPPTSEQVKEQRERQARDRGEVDNW